MPSHLLRRREFVTLLGGGVTAWPRGGRAQQAGRVRRIGVLMALPEDDPELKLWLGGFREKIEALGWTGATCTSIIVLHPLRVPKKHEHLRRNWWRCSRM